MAKYIKGQAVLLNTPLMVFNRDKSLRRYLSQNPSRLKDEVRIVSITNGFEDADGWITETTYQVTIMLSNQQFMGTALEHMLEAKT